MKRMLAYSLGRPRRLSARGARRGRPRSGSRAALFYLGVYALMTVGAFAVVAVVAGEGERHAARRFPRPGLEPALARPGCWWSACCRWPASRRPAASWASSTCCEPRWTPARSGLAVVLVLTSLLSYYYYLRVVWKMYFEEAPADVPEPDVTGRAFRFAGRRVRGGHPGRRPRARAGRERGGQRRADRGLGPVGRRIGRIDGARSPAGSEAGSAPAASRGRGAGVGAAPASLRRAASALPPRTHGPAHHRGEHVGPATGSSVSTTSAA